MTGAKRPNPSAQGSGRTSGTGPARVGAPSPGTDFYQLLGVPYSASQADITAAYRRLMKENHPDRQMHRRQADAEEAAKTLNLAYATLSKPDKRRAYDQTIRQQIVQDQIMGRYVGGFGVPGQHGQANPDLHGQRLRRNLTERERLDQQHTNRRAIVTIAFAFGGLLVVFLAILVLYAVISAIGGAIS